MTKQEVTYQAAGVDTAEGARAVDHRPVSRGVDAGGGETRLMRHRPARIDADDRMDTIFVKEVS